MGDAVSRETPPSPAEAAGVFGAALPTAERYAGLLAGPGTVRGLLGPREVPRLWERHLLNCAVVADLVPEGASVCDVGSGAGLPGMVLAIRRPDLRVTLVEPLLRRTRFLEEVAEELGIDNVEIIRARAEAIHGVREFDVVTSRAVAPLAKLLAWSLPLTRPGGSVLAMKGAAAAEELRSAAEVIGRLGAIKPELVHIEQSNLSFPTTVVRVGAGSVGRLGLAERGPDRGRGPRRRRK